MKINRNGNEYELTHFELMEASREYDHLCMEADVENTLKTYCFQFPMAAYMRSEDFAAIAEDAQKGIDRSDDVADVREQAILNAANAWVESHWMALEKEDFLSYNNNGRYVIDSCVFDDFVEGEIFDVVITDICEAKRLRMIEVEDGNIVCEEVNCDVRDR